MPLPFIISKPSIAYSLVAHGSAGMAAGPINSGTAGNVLSVSSTVGSRVVLFIATTTNTAGAVSGVASPMGTFVKQNAIGNGTISAELECWVCSNVTGVSQAVTVTCGGQQWGASGIEFTGGQTGTATAITAAASTSSAPSLTGTPSGIGNLVVIGYLAGATQSSTPSSPWADWGGGQIPFNSIADFDASYQVVPSGAAVTATWGLSGSAAWMATGVVLS